ncbi:hypothetical protein SAMN05421821_105178 [Mucilaginibacter lappiensis]|uniref:Uncharacterized protein n=1 Tax=Mucilaginibacter lappiensis TaxID=354630 RepID=A0ABR6PJ03_9SPHI|nr:hypothetical protein [Mucilaginibacter lappiensis]SIR14641.1 hypothetical protein SAMN05421821_105178 [Mucilaginibacter lappiensis]
MSYSKDAFIQFQEAEYYQSEAFQIKQHLLMPAVKNQQATKPKSHATTKVQN